MGRQRTASPGSTEAPEDQRKVEAAAADIAALFMASGGVSVGAVAGILLPLLPAWLLATPRLAVEVAEEAARIALTNPPTFSTDVGEYERRASLENLILRGYFALATLRRLSEAVRGPSDTSTPERLAKALRAESSYLTAHNNARARNLDAARKTDKARELFGDDVSWNHGVRGQPMEPRPSHVAADGRVWDLRRGIPVSTGSLPGVLPGCTCAWGPPSAEAKTLV